MKLQTLLIKEVLDLMKYIYLKTYKYMQNYLQIIVNIKQ
jgi:hypothetical protein